MASAKPKSCKKRRQSLIRHIPAILFLLVAVLSAICCNRGHNDFDILIVNGTIIDGSGKAGFHGDIGITGDTISEIGDLEHSPAKKIIDARGLVVSPGFIDVHTHCDYGLGELDSNANLNYLIQGTTTVVTGNCGGGTFRITETIADWENLGEGK